MGLAIGCDGARVAKNASGFAASAECACGVVAIAAYALGVIEAGRVVGEGALGGRAAGRRVFVQVAEGLGEEQIAIGCGVGACTRRDGGFGPACSVCCQERSAINRISSDAGSSVTEGERYGAWGADGILIADGLCIGGAGHWNG
jgi:hypothetical protein